jgi:acetoin utilization protein AcuB
MSKPIPTIQKYMTTSPHFVGAEQPLIEAHRRLREFGIRHLPVLQGGKLVGIVTERDLHWVETLQGVEASAMAVEQAMSQNVYAVHPDAPLDEVVDEMARQKYGSAVVLQNGRVVGIFTTVDACAALRDLLRSRLSH